MEQNLVENDMVREIIRTKNAPMPKGPYSQGIKVGNFVFISGQGPFDPETGERAGSDVESQTRQTLHNIRAIVEESGFSMRDVVHMMVFLKNVGDFPKTNELYKDFFGERAPTMTIAEANFVAQGILVTIDAIAYRE
jgi:2-iminobutanoate/2-iminopropanoate deaminase